jgi:hypothetical protein
VPASLTERGWACHCAFVGIRVGVQLEGRTEGHAAVGGADVKDVAWVAIACCVSVDEANYVIEAAGSPQPMCRQ